MGTSTLFRFLHSDFPEEEEEKLDEEASILFGFLHPQPVTDPTPSDDERSSRARTTEEAIFEQGARFSLKDSPVVRSVKSGFAQVGSDVKSLVQRVLGDVEGANQTLKEAEALGQLNAQADEFSAIPNTIQRGIRSMISSLTQLGILAPTGPIGIIGGFGLSRFNQALGEADRAGFDESEAISFASKAGIIEAGITAIFQGIGRGGLEAMFGRSVSTAAAQTAGKTVAKQGLKEGLKAVGRGTINELAEEEIISILDLANQKVSDINPEAFTPERIVGTFQSAVVDTAVATVMTMGAAHGAAGAASLATASKATEIDETVDPISSRPLRAEESIDVKEVKETQREEVDKSLEIDRSRTEPPPGRAPEAEATDVPTSEDANVEVVPEQGAEVQDLGGEEKTEGTERGKVNPSFPVDQIELDPKRFQFKLSAGPQGTTGALSDVQSFDPNLAGIVQVYQEPESGRVFVVNGHNRVVLAKRALSEGQSVAATIPVRFLDVESESEARAVGALTNIAEGRGTSLDAAKFFRDTGLNREDLQAKGVPLRENTAAEGLGLANLAPALFNRVVEGDLSVRRGALIGEKLSDENIQLQLVDEILREENRGRKVNDATVSELIDQINVAPVATETQETLFGDETRSRSLAFDRARLVSTIRGRLGKDKRLFALVSKNAAGLERGGNVIDSTGSAAVSSEAAVLLDIFDRVKDIKGPVSDVLNRAAERIGSGEDAKTVTKEAFEEIRAPLSEVITRAKAKGPGRSEGDTAGAETQGLSDPFALDAGTGQSDLFAEASSPESTSPESEPEGAVVPSASVEDEAVASLRESASPINTETDEGSPGRESSLSDEQIDSRFDDEGGFIKIDSVTEATKKVGRSTRGFLRRFFTSKGDLPQDTFEAMIKRDGWFNSQTKRIQFTLRDFDKAAGIAYGGRNKMTNEQIQAVDAVMKGEVEPQTIPKPMRAITQRMRDEIDAMSARLLDSGLAEGELRATIEENLGFYAKRSYRAFKDPSWAEKVPPEVRARAKSFLRQQFQVPENLEGLSRGQLLRLARSHGLVGGPQGQPRADFVPDLKSSTLIEALKNVGNTEEKIEGLIDQLLYEGKAAESPVAMLAKGKLGSKDLSIFKKRKEIAPEIRELLGEFKNARVNYTQSVSSMAQVISNHQFLEQVKRDGVGRFLFRTPITNEDGQFKTRIASDESSALSPLNGLFTTPEIKRAFEDALEPKTNPLWLRVYLGANSAVKLSKTVFSPMTHVRNVVGNIGFAVANGHWRVGKAGGAFKTTMASIGALSDAKYRDLFLKMQRLGVVHESARAGELRDVIRDASQGNIDQFAEDSARGLGGRLVRGTVEVYRVEDDIWKVFAFENEKARYAKALPDATESEIEEIAARIVRNTYPTYSLVPKGIKLLRRFPVVGTFVSFPAEVARTGWNTLSLARSELADPQLRGIGAQRAAGIVTAASGVYAVSMASAFLFGIGRDDEEDLREFLPPWTKNSQLIHLGRRKNGNYRYIDLGYSDPYSYLRNPVTALLRGDDFEDGLIEAMMEAFEPFLGEEILFGKILDVRRNKKPNGGRVFNPEDEFLKRSEDIALHFYDAFEPGAFRSARRVVSGLRGEVNIYGKSFDPTLESLAVVTGQRLSEVDVRQSLSFHTSRFSEGLSDSTRILLKTAGRSGTVSSAELTDAFMRSNRARHTWFDRLHGQARAAIRLGVTGEEVEAILLSGGLSKQNAKSVIDGGYKPYIPSSTFLSSLSGRINQEDVVARQQLMVKLGIAAFDDEYGASLAMGDVISSELGKAFRSPLAAKDRERDESDASFSQRRSKREREISQARQFLSGLEIDEDQAVELLIIREMDRTGKTRVAVIRSRRTKTGKLTLFGKKLLRIRRLLDKDVEQAAKKRLRRLESKKKAL
ncbi:hypothetical protein LCGC14_0696830 [marine sediment metagenome]|uniref:Uncharacterized protein n=1 Tax=marine sediment metagenome TaxID=412755 RepID=A0A0F9R498_9ZZZZ